MLKSNIILIIDKAIDNPTPIERINMCLEHLNNLYELKDEKLAVLEIRNHIAWYFKGIKGANEIKNKVYQTSSIHDIISLLNGFREG